MKYASIFLISLLTILFVAEVHSFNSSLQESLINCIKLRQQVPELNLNCEEIIFSHNESEGRKGVSFVELNEKEKTENKEKFISYDPEEETEKELGQIEKLEKMIESLNGNVKNMNEELKMLKSKISKKNKKVISPPKSSDINFDLITGRSKLNDAIKNKNDIKRVLKMKTFNDLELDLNLLKNKNNDSNDIKQEDFLNNILRLEQESSNNMKNKKSKEEINPEFFKEIPIKGKKINKLEDDAEKLNDLINKLKRDRQNIFNGLKN